MNDSFSEPVSRFFTGLGWPVLSLTVLLILSGLFSATETAFTALGYGQVNRLAETRGHRGRQLKSLHERPHILLTSLLIGNNLVNLGASALVTATVIHNFGNRFVALATGALTLIVLVFCEVTPKQIALVRNETLSLRAAKPVLFLSWVFRPIIWVVTAISRSFTRLLAGRERPPMTLENLLHHVKAAEGMGIVKPFEEEMVRNVFRIHDTPIEAIMTHRMELFTLNENTTLTEARTAFLESGHSRAPVLRDDSGHVSGLVNLREVVRNITENADAEVKTVMGRPYLVPGTLKVFELLFRFQREKVNLAVVLDEYGGLDGVVTREDVVEEIFGELYDEHEEVEIEPVRPDGSGGWIMQGDADFWALRDRLNLNLEHDNRIHTLGGYIMEKLDRIPAAGTVVDLPEGLYEVLEIKKNRIVSLRFIPSPSEKESEE